MSYLGEICYTLRDGTFRPPDPSQPGQLGVLSFGPNHFALYCMRGDLQPLHGTVSFDGANYIFTLNTLGA